MAEAGDRVPADATLVGVGWTTVETRPRRRGDRGRRSRRRPTTRPSAPGAARPSGADGVTVVLLEPATEGRLACVARPPRRGSVRHLVGRVTGIDRLPVLGPSSGPLGPVRLLRDRPPDGRWQFLRERAAATISA